MEKRKIKVSYLITALILTGQCLVLVVLYFFVKGQLTKNIENNTVANMQTVVTERSSIIENYVKETEMYLTAYSRAGEITALLKNPTDPAAAAAAQKYTETFSADMDNLEGIYASEWNTHVLAHTNAPVVGITTRTGDPLVALQNAMLAADGVYNTGIIISPASGQQIISMYRACYDENGAPIGLVGGGIFTTGLKQILNSLPVNGLEQAKYYLINANTGEYIFHESEEMIGTVAEEKYVTDIIASLALEKESITDFREEKDLIAAYHYIADRGWIFLLTDTPDEIFASVNQTKQTLIILCLSAVILLTAVSYFTISVSMKPLNPIGKTLLRIANCDLTDDAEIMKYIDRKDDLGGIAEASKTVINSLRDIIVTLKNCTGDMNTKVYELKDSSVNLVDCVTDNIAITEELSASLENLNVATENINTEITSIHDSINSIAGNLQESNSSSDVMLDGAKQMKDTAKNAFQNSKDKLEETKKSVKEAMESLNSLSQINGMASSILDIASQTNLLSINAAIEAARSGEAGRGFAVVAEEIGKLADTSKDTASQIQKLCEFSNHSIATVNECVEEIMQFMEKDVLNSFGEFASHSEDYTVSVEKIKKDIEHVGNFVKDLKTSVKEISNNIADVNYSAKENKSAIEVIVEKNEVTSGIAHDIQKQSEENHEVAGRLEGIVSKFNLQ
ncbi:MAG: methyl-accepting chemotaxis protein [Lachnospiraceae bacterium]|nr:methyl-accepting chemotaxis protein [Lachnospiraceae bacterium]